jgi:hypothetical protein
MESHLDERKVRILQAIVYYVRYLMEEGSDVSREYEAREVLSNVNTILAAIDEDENEVSVRDLDEINEIIEHSKNVFSSRMMI